jgi:predicted dithiol-disulfide oxidoreductase (DUF899 family)
MSKSAASRVYPVKADHPEGRTMDTPRIVARDEWLTARKALMAKEKEFTRLRDQLTAERSRG